MRTWFLILSLGVNVVLLWVLISGEAKGTEIVSSTDVNTPEVIIALDTAVESTNIKFATQKGAGGTKVTAVVKDDWESTNTAADYAWLFIPSDMKRHFLSVGLVYGHYGDGGHGVGARLGYAHRSGFGFDATLGGIQHGMVFYDVSFKYQIGLP